MITCAMYEAPMAMLMVIYRDFAGGIPESHVCINIWIIIRFFCVMIGKGVEGIIATF